MESSTMTATYHDGTLTLQEPIDLPNGSHVEIQITVVDDGAASEPLVDAWTAQIRRESEAFIKQHAILLGQYRGQYVAIHNSNVVDHDTNKRALALRLRSEWHDVPVLIRLVTESPIREIVLRSPRLER